MTDSREATLTIKPHLFGTSGIRGIFSSTVVIDPVADFINGNVLTPALACLLADAMSGLYRESGNVWPVEIWRDVRPSGEALVQALLHGFRIHRIDTIYRGIAPTTLYSARSDRWVIVVTASHNPAAFNGLKIFHEGRPLEKNLEAQIETFMGGNAKKSYPDPIDIDLRPEPAVIAETRDLQTQHLTSEVPLDRLRSDFAGDIGNLFLPLDLAYGASACPTGDSGKILELSPSMGILLSLGFPVVGYGCTQDPVRTNEQIGAAYAYGETSDQPGAHEMAAFSRGESGYGSPAERIVFWPGEQQFLADEIFPPKTEGRTSDLVYRVENDTTKAAAEVTVMHIDHPCFPEPVKTAVEMELFRRKPLPGFMVDCDADRILVTTPRLAMTSIPYLTGDGMIRFFAETSPPDTWDEVAFTIESGLSVDVALDRIVHKRKSIGIRHFDIRKVTVGDRAIIDCFLDAGPGKRMGGEPSGHMIFDSCCGSRHHLIDDPFVTYFLLLNQLRELDSDLDQVMERLFDDVPEVYCARKPDARCESGLTQSEKNRLELWENTTWGLLSSYARSFIPEYVVMFSAPAGDFWDWGLPERIDMSEQWKQLEKGSLGILADGWRMPLARVRFRAGGLLEASLYLDPRSWAGPEVIRIEFFAGLEGKEMQRIGEGVFRNSGTGPKNAGYHKIWIKHPVSGKILPHSKLVRILNELAICRAAFTDRYVMQVLREGKTRGLSASGH